MRPGVVLLAEDDGSDIELTERVLERCSVATDLVVAQDGSEAPDYVFGTGAHAGRGAFRSSS